MAPARTLTTAALLLVLAACSNAPQQPSDTVDDKAAESPTAAAEPTPEEEASPDFAELAEPEDSTTTGAIAPVGPTDASAVTGRWAADAATCTEAGGAVVSISSTRFESIDRTCSVADLIDGGGGSITATLSCPSDVEGQTDSELIKLTPQDGGLAISFIGGSESEQQLQRCP